VTSKQSLGKKGEELACAFLEQKGHCILFRNHRSGHSELDIVSREAGTLIVTEVKSFNARPLGAAEFRVNAAKQRKIISGTYALLSMNAELQGLNVRFDVIIVDFSAYPAVITHHQGAFWDEQGWG
jgi:putative endonuclease